MQTEVQIRNYSRKGLLQDPTRQS